MDLPEWLQAWQVWLGLAVTLGVAEMMSLDLMLLMLATGAMVGMVAALVGLPFAVQILAAAAASVAMIAVVRPGLVKRFHGGPELTLGHAALVGKQGLVVDEVSTEGGQVRIGGELWTARPYDETEVIEAGAKVDVFQIKGATAYVHRIPTLEP